MWLVAAVLDSTILEYNWGVLVPKEAPNANCPAWGSVLFISGSDFTGEFLYYTLGSLSGECLPGFFFLWAMRLTWLTYKTPLAVESMVFWDLTLAGFRGWSSDCPFCESDTSQCWGCAAWIANWIYLKLFWGGGTAHCVHAPSLFYSSLKFWSVNSRVPESCSRGGGVEVTQWNFTYASVQALMRGWN